MEAERFDLDGDGLLGEADIHLLVQHLRPGAAAKAIVGQQTLTQVSLLPPYPNPFNSQTVLAFQLPEAQPAVLALFNLIGQQVRKLVAETKGAGVHRVVWDGRDEVGRPVRSGVYFAVLSTPGTRQVARVLLLR